MSRRLKRMVDRTLVYYVIIGILNFIVCTAIMFLLFNFCGVGERIAPLFNYGLGSLIWYLACRFVIFRGKQNTWQQIVRFLAEVVACYLICYYLVAPLLSKALLRYERVRRLFSFGGSRETMIRGNCELTIGTLAYAVLNYFGQRYFVFSGRYEFHRKRRLAAAEDPHGDMAEAEEE